ncbi:MAG: Asp-tRNA(Asn)/Glu-tRNA(Gln) amidotransferase subunit GatA, partial [Candidatus Aureabacteria bacterium]|nr:Asp-tRNA(Asn)/Glu-tRNA(Gln) amidotransferase subunit GatA [Candidatus Auribacterota bacterium]
AVDGMLRSFVEVYDKEALAAAEAVDRRIGAGESVRPLEGVPLAIKDNLCLRGHAVTCASKILKGFVAPYTATVLDRLGAAGAIFIGRTNMDEFAMGSSTENSSCGVTKNPWDINCVPGGSSGGSAAAVAAREVPAALGSDTGGSIRQPASLCGVAGLKPTYGCVSRYGLVAFASSLDQIGPFARTVKDIALILEIMGGHDPMDSTSADRKPRGIVESVGRGVKGMRVGIPREYFGEGMDSEVASAVRAAIDTLRGAGAEPVEVSLPHTEYAVATYYIIATAEASSNLARFDGVQYGYRTPSPANLLDMYELTKAEGFGDEVKRRIMLGTYVLSSGYYDAYYLKAQKARTLLKRDFDEAFTRCDIIATPTAPTAAFRIGEKLSDPLQMYLYDIFTISVNLAGVPAVSIPCGLTSGGLPIGFQLIGRPFDEATLLAGAGVYEKLTEWHTKQPKI